MSTDQRPEPKLGAMPRPELRFSPGPHHHLWEFHCRLIALRQSIGVLSTPDPAYMEVFRVGRTRIGVIHRWNDTEGVCIVFHAGNTPVSAMVPLPAGCWKKEIDSAEVEWGGSGSALAGTIDSEGEVVMELSPYAFFMLSKQVSE